MFISTICTLECLKIGKKKKSTDIALVVYLSTYGRDVF